MRIKAKRKKNAPCHILVFVRSCIARDVEVLGQIDETWYSSCSERLMRSISSRCFMFYVSYQARVDFCDPFFLVLPGFMRDWLQCWCVHYAPHLLWDQHDKAPWHYRKIEETIAKEWVGRHYRKKMSCETLSHENELSATIAIKWVVRHYCKRISCETLSQENGLWDTITREWIRRGGYL